MKIGEIFDYYNKGMYIIIFFEMFLVDGGGYIIDILGIKGFGIFDMEEEEVGYYFKEIFEYFVYCKYGNCIYRYEFGCVVCDVVEKYLISELCYIFYLNMLEDKEEGKYCVVY